MVARAARQSWASPALAFSFGASIERRPRPAAGEEDAVVSIGVWRTAGTLKLEADFAGPDGMVWAEGPIAFEREDSEVEIATWTRQAVAFIGSLAAVIHAQWMAERAWSRGEKAR